MSNQLIEYMKIHLISLEQDLEKLQEEMDSIEIGSKEFGQLDIEYNWVSGQIIATRHFLSVADDMIS
ncbi:hypothetical protein EB001_14165 [bacterium]|nr:hypothetical protein [bacterium]